MRLLKAKLSGERLATPVIDLERFGVAGGSVEGEHQLPAQPLAVPVLGHERLELADQLAVVPEREIGLDPVLECCRPELLKTCNLRGGGSKATSDKRLAAPMWNSRTFFLARGRCTVTTAAARPSKLRAGVCPPPPTVPGAFARPVA